MSGSESPFHRGEKALQTRLGVADRSEQLGRRMIRQTMADWQQAFLAQLSLFFLGGADAGGRPWASVLSAQPGFLQPVDESVLRVRARPCYGDPLAGSLIDGTFVGTLAVDFENRGRVRVNGTLADVGADGFDIRVTQAFGNCDQYIQARMEKPAAGTDVASGKRTVRRGTKLNKAEAALIADSDTFFIATQSAGENERNDGFDVSHRGGRPGFVIVAHESLLLFPDYPGNNMFNTLGNLQVDPRAGLLFIDFETGDTLHITGTADILWEPHHTVRFPGAERVVAFSVEKTLFIARALALTWTFREYSPIFDSLAAAQRREPTAGELPPMKLVSVNLAMPREVAHGNRRVTTGIFKTPAIGRVKLRRLNLEGDGQADLWGHGGAFRAVLVYSLENYEHWRRDLGRNDLVYGQFGENFTVKGMTEDCVRVGDLIRIGSALVEVSQPRIPCHKLALKMGIDNFQNRFLESGRVGFYLRVLEEGEVGAGDPIELMGRDPDGMSIRRVSELLFHAPEDLAGAAEALAIPALSHGWKGSFEERLATADAAAPQRGFRDLVVRRKEVESESITSFYLQAADGKALAPFLPGQFLTFELAIPGHTEAVVRTYSLSDSPDRDYYRVSIKRESPPPAEKDLPPGLSSSYFHDKVEEGMTLRVGPPRGRFHLDPNGERALVLLSAGVGLTPMISMMNALVSSGSKWRMWFIHGARNGREHAFGAHVRGMAEANANVTVHTRYSQPRPEDVAGRDYDSAGHVDVDLLKRLLPFDGYEFYLCGPAHFMKALYCGLLSLGIAESRVHYEFFGPATTLRDEVEPQDRAPARSPSDELGGACEVTFARSGITAAWDSACETILDLAEYNGLAPPYSCRSGICRTCMCEVVEGEVEYLDEPLTAPDPGAALICIARPRGKVILDI